MTNATATAIFQADLASDGKAVPEWVQLFPAGPEIVARDGRKWTAGADAVIATFTENQGPLPIDYEHAQDHLAPQGIPAPAAGWIVALEKRNGEVWGKVEWTEKAAAMIASREYRFLSPAFMSTKSGRITRLVGAGLVNRPALVMTALAKENHQQETNMLKAIAQALGLAGEADEQAILSAIAERNGERKALCQALKIEESGGHAEITAAIAKLQEDKATALASVQTGAAAELAAVRAELAQLQKKDTEREIDLALDDATKAGKITPASRGTYRAMCALEGGLDQFKALVKTLPQIAAPSALDGQQAETAAETELDPVELAAEARKYQNEQAAQGITVTITQAVDHVKEKRQ